MPVKILAVDVDGVGYMCFNDKYFKNHSKNYKALIRFSDQSSALNDYYENK